MQTSMVKLSKIEKRKKWLRYQIFFFVKVTIAIQIFNSFLRGKGRLLKTVENYKFL